MDNLSGRDRRKCMSKVKNRNTLPELVLRKALWRKGHRYRIKSRVFGKPDLVFHGLRVVVFVDGCFWHGCSVHKSLPRTNRDFWESKIARNQARDVLVTHTLEKDGWLVLRFWEHDLKNSLPDVIMKVEAALAGR